MINYPALFIGAVLLVVVIMYYRLSNECSRLRKKLSDKAWQNTLDEMTIVERSYKFMNIENAGDNSTMNKTAEKWKEEGYQYDREKSTDKLIVYVKKVTAKERKDTYIPNVDQIKSVYAAAGILSSLNEKTDSDRLMALWADLKKLHHDRTGNQSD